ncbi:hypothetical protein K488DRAFT_82316 [Vararia minispora EC-137]|uniref:Uncharacterized protein n=1 Tax=Vararia minispora EC-137 TaxID=1314806 RepID=A0ACB8QX32_9AGAM|nr:hypothetical protein K488DRAFT_82316 [Vararia minispora EC-137]
MSESDHVSLAGSQAQVRQDVELEAVQQQQILVMDRMLDHVETLHTAQLQHTQIIADLQAEVMALRGWAMLGVKAFNQQRGVGGDGDKSYAVLPLPNGRSPIDTPYNLPHISSLRTLNAMPIGHVNTYLQLYALDDNLPDSDNRRRHRLAIHIGIQSDYADAVWS